MCKYNTYSISYYMCASVMCIYILCTSVSHQTLISDGSLSHHCQWLRTFSDSIQRVNSLCSSMGINGLSRTEDSYRYNLNLDLGFPISPINNWLPSGKRGKLGNVRIKFSSGPCLALEGT